LSDRAIESSIEFRAHRDRGVEALRLGDLETALACFDGAIEAARSSGDEDLVDLAECNRAAIRIELGDGRAVLPSMRDVLMRSHAAQTCMVAATNAARVHDLEKDWKKALFYARLAYDHGERSGDDSQRASLRNLIANLLLAESRVDEAAAGYESALSLMPDDDPVWRARAVGNLGYCRILQQRLHEAFALLREGIAALRERAARRYLVSPLLDLAFAHLEANHPADARASAEEALALAREFADVDAIKNALYLVGQAAGLEGDVEGARRCFGELQSKYYPGMPFVAEFLLSVDVRKVVNLRA
jgi:tetratricopeptide (TPR) repeat protein